MKLLLLALIFTSTALLIGCSDKQLSEIPQIYRGEWIDSWEIGAVVRLKVTNQSIRVFRDTGEELICRSKKITERRKGIVVVVCEESMAKRKVRRLNELYHRNVSLEKIEWKIALNGDRFGFQATERFDPFHGTYSLGGDWIRR